MESSTPLSILTPARPTSATRATAESTLPTFLRSATAKQQPSPRPATWPPRNRRSLAWRWRDFSTYPNPARYIRRIAKIPLATVPAQVSIHLRFTTHASRIACMTSAFLGSSNSRLLVMKLVRRMSRALHTMSPGMPSDGTAGMPLIVALPKETARGIEPEEVACLFILVRASDLAFSTATGGKDDASTLLRRADQQNSESSRVTMARTSRRSASKRRRVDRIVDRNSTDGHVLH